MDTIFDSKFAKGLQKFGEALGSNRYLSAISGGLMGTMALMLLGAFFQIVAGLLNLAGLAPQDSELYSFLITPYNMSMGLISVFVAFGIAYVLARSFDMKAMQAGVASLVVFLLVAAPAKTVTLAPTEGSETTTTITVLDSANLGGTGLFTAIVIGLVTVRITKLIYDKRLYIRMPEVVPTFLSDSFAALVPIVVNALLFHGLNFVIALWQGVTLPVAITNLLAVPFAGITSLPGMLILIVFCLILWVFGIHGTMIGYTVVMAPMMAVILQNGALHEAGQPLVFEPVLLFMAVAALGGTGNTLALVLMGLRSKSEQLKAVSRAAVVPGLFNVNEPVIFGFPIMYNPILAIPYILNPLVVMLLAYAGYMTDILQPAYVMIMALMPIGMAEFLGTMSWTNLLFPFLIVLPVTALIWYPFFRIYERQLVTKEAAIATASGAEAVDAVAVAVVEPQKA